MQLAQAGRHTDRRAAAGKKAPPPGGRARARDDDKPRAAPAAAPAGGEAAAGTRTCVACRQTGARGELVRLVEGEGGAIAVDARTRTGGRGAWVHPTRGCITAAAKRHGAERSLKVPVREVDAGALLVQTRAAFARKIASLLLAARRAGGIAGGASAVADALERSRVPLVLVATDAGETSRALVEEAGAAAGGTHVRTFATKDALGAALGRAEIALLAVSDHGIAAELIATIDRLAGLEG
jgi:predicted RNA-binding protein YlxR (DUF448 family)